MHSIFEEMRRANADWYTASPLETLNEEELVRLAEEAGMSVEELCHHLTTPHVEMSCPLCGRPSTHLIGCKGCGGDAWGWEFEEAHGEEARDQLRQHLRKLLLVANEVMPDQVEHALKHAFAWGGCMVCDECWHNTLPYDAYLICPLNLLADRRLRPGYSPKGTYWLPQGPLDPGVAGRARSSHPVLARGHLAALDASLEHGAGRTGARRDQGVAGRSALCRADGRTSTGGPG